MKTTILTIALALASAFSALAQTVMRENSTVYFQTNVYLHDDPTNALHTRISVEGMEPLWVAASNQVVYYLGGEITNAMIHADDIIAEQFTCKADAVIDGIDLNGGLTMYGGIMTGAGYINATNISANNISSKWVYIDGSLDVTEDIVMRSGILDFTSNSCYIHMGSNNIYTVGTIDARTAQVERVEISDSLYFDDTMYLKSGGIELGKNDGIPGSSLDHSYCFVFNGHAYSQPPDTTADGQAVFLTPGGFRVIGGSGITLDSGNVTADGVIIDKVYFGTTNRSWLKSDGTNLFFISTVPPGFTNALTTNAP